MTATKDLSERDLENSDKVLKAKIGFLQDQIFSTLGKRYSLHKAFTQNISENGMTRIFYNVIVPNSLFDENVGYLRNIVSEEQLLWLLTQYDVSKFTFWCTSQIKIGKRESNVRTTTDYKKPMNRCNNITVETCLTAAFIEAPIKVEFKKNTNIAQLGADDQDFMFDEALDEIDDTEVEALKRPDDEWERWTSWLSELNRSKRKGRMNWFLFDFDSSQIECGKKKSIDSQFKAEMSLHVENELEIKIVLTNCEFMSRRFGLMFELSVNEVDQLNDVVCERSKVQDVSIFYGRLILVVDELRSVIGFTEDVCSDSLLNLGKFVDVVCARLNLVVRTVCEMDLFVSRNEWLTEKDNMNMNVAIFELRLIEFKRRIEFESHILSLCLIDWLSQNVIYEQNVALLLVVFLTEDDFFVALILIGCDRCDNMKIILVLSNVVLKRVEDITRVGVEIYKRLLNMIHSEPGFLFWFIDFVFIRIFDLHVEVFNSLTKTNQMNYLTRKDLIDFLMKDPQNIKEYVEHINLPTWTPSTADGFEKGILECQTTQEL